MNHETESLWCDTVNIGELEDSENVCDLKTAIFNLLEDVQCLKEERDRMRALAKARGLPFLLMTCDRALSAGEGGYDGSKDYVDKTGFDGSKGAKS